MTIKVVTAERVARYSHKYDVPYTSAKKALERSRLKQIIKNSNNIEELKEVLNYLIDNLN